MQARENPQISIIVPTLNEEKNVGLLLDSAEQQLARFETIIIDGGSKDKTSQVAREHNAEIIVMPGHGEFISRNIGARNAKGRFLLFTCADIIFPEHLFERIAQKFSEDPSLIALSGPDCPFDGPLLGKVEYAVYNFARYLSTKVPVPFKRFSTSTNFLVIRKDCFERSGGFLVDDINADGLIGKKLLGMGKVAFFLDTYVFSSARRMRNMGFLAFNRHYLYVLENFLFSASKFGALGTLKSSSKGRHRKMHET